ARCAQPWHATHHHRRDTARGVLLHRRPLPQLPPVRGAPMNVLPSEPVRDLQAPRAWSCLRAGQGRTRARGEAPWMAPALRSEEWTSVHDRLMTQACGQTDRALRVFTGRPPCGGAWLDLPARQALRHTPPPDDHSVTTR